MDGVCNCIKIINHIYTPHPPTQSLLTKASPPWCCSSFLFPHTNKNKLVSTLSLTHTQHTTQHTDLSPLPYKKIKVKQIKSMGVEEESCQTRLVLGLGSEKVAKKSPPLTLSLFGEAIDGQDSAASSLSNASVKRERDEEVDDRASSDDDGSHGRKKLRLNKAQSALLEESFKHHSTLNPVSLILSLYNLSLYSLSLSHPCMCVVI